MDKRDWKIPKIDFSKVDKLQEVKKQFVYSYLTICKTYEEYPQNKMTVTLADYYSDHDLLLKKTMLVMEIINIWKTKALHKQSATFMISLHGIPNHMYSDNGLYFKKANKMLHETVEANNQVIKGRSGAV